MVIIFQAMFVEIPDDVSLSQSYKLLVVSMIHEKRLYDSGSRVQRVVGKLLRLVPGALAQPMGSVVAFLTKKFDARLAVRDRRDIAHANLAFCSHIKEETTETTHQIGRAMGRWGDAHTYNTFCQLHTATLCHV